MRKALAFSLVCLTVLLAGSIAWGQAPKKIGEIYQTQVWARSPSSQGSGELADKPLTATLNVFFTEGSDAPPTTMTLEFEPPQDAVVIAVPRASVPQQFEGVMGDFDEKLFLARSPYGHDRRTLVDLADKPTNDPRSLRKDLTLEIVDAQGRPAQGIEVEIKADIGDPTSGKRFPYVLAKRVIGADGRLLVSLPRAPRAPGFDIFSPASGMMFNQGFSAGTLTATDPVSGQKHIMSFPVTRYVEGKFEVLDKIPLFLLAGDKADPQTPVFSGTVLGDSAQPVPNAGITPGWLQMPAGQGKQFDSIGSIRAGKDGRFRFAIPKDWLEASIGQGLLPEPASLRVTVEGLREAWLTPNEENILRTGKTKAFAFQFVDENGKVLLEDAKAAANIHPLRLKRLDKTSDTLAGSLVPVEVRKLDEATGIAQMTEVPVPATYELTVGEQHYLAQRFESGMDVIRWVRDSSHAVVSGRVVDALSGEPISGAYLCSSHEGSAPWTLATMADSEREEIWNRWQKGDRTMVENDSIRLKGGGFLYSVVTLGRSGSDGTFRLEFPSGKPAKSVQVWAAGHVVAKADLYILHKQPYEPIELPDAVLQPAAQLKVTVKAPEKVPDPYLRGDGGAAQPGTLCTVVVADAGATWKAKPPELNPTRQNPWQTVTCASWNSFGQPYLVLAPAGCKCSVYASTPNVPTLGFASWRDIGPFETGSTNELEPKPISVKRPFLIEVKKANGQPAAGMGVSVDRMMAIMTDEKGSAIGWSEGHVDSVMVMPKTGWKPLAEKSNFDIPQGSELFKVLLTIPDDAGAK